MVALHRPLSADGLRTYKKVGSTVHEYEYAGDKLVYEKRGNLRFYYRYDAYGELASIKRVEANGTELPLFVINNSRGDVEELRKMDGTLYARYVYDSWGNTLHIYNANGTEITDPANLAKQNPFRYRGYYFDAESGLCYLQSRYYDPQTGRFVNGDGYISTGSGVLGYNMFAYCENNPVINIDPTGERQFECCPTGNCAYCRGNINNANGDIVVQKIKPNFAPRKDVRHGSENRQPSGARERNKAHPNSEEHSIKAKGNRGTKKARTPMKRISNLVPLATVAVCVVAIVVIVSDDATGIGVINDVALPSISAVLWDTMSKLAPAVMY